jgi:two-component system response regulator DesR
MVRVLLAEDQAMIRAALLALLKRESDIEVVAEVDRGDLAIEFIKHNPVDVALLDIEMPGMDGLTTVATLAALGVSCRSLILTTYGKPGYLRRAMENGASGFILKDSPPGTLSDAIRRVAAGQRYLDPSLAVSALLEGRNPLSIREREVLRACADGVEVSQVAERLHLSVGTVRNHLSIAMQKIDVKTRFEAVRVAEERGWL